MKFPFTNKIRDTELQNSKKKASGTIEFIV